MKRFSAEINRQEEEMEYPLEYVQERAAMEDKERTMWAEKVSKYARLLSRLLPYCTSPAGENYPE